MLLSADAVLEHGTLRVHGIEDSPNTIVVGNSADGLNVNVSVSTLKKNGVTKTITASFPKTLGINKVRINGGHQADTISIDQTTSAFAIKTSIQGGGGKDVFVHISAVERAGLSTLNEGQQVDYEIVSNRGKESAENLKVK